MATRFVTNHLQRNKCISALFSSTGYSRIHTAVNTELVGRSGRTYTIEEVLKTFDNNPDWNITRARSQERSFVLKPIDSDILEKYERLGNEFGNTPYIRKHVDFIEQGEMAVFDWSKETLLTFIKRNKDLPSRTRKHILQEAFQALKRLHGGKWMHMDVKPDNFMIESSVHPELGVEVQSVVLSDLDYAIKTREGVYYRGPPVGNVRWSSVEALTGKGIGLFSDIYSFGLLCLYVMTGREFFAVDPGPEVKEEARYSAVKAEVLARHLSYFGPLPMELLRHIEDDYWCSLLVDIRGRFSEENPRTPLSLWGGVPNLDEGLKGFLSRTNNLDPAKRATVDEIENHLW